MSHLDPGTTIHHYRIVRTLGSGGMGDVYEALDQSLDRPVAVKVLPPELVADADRVRRFVQEAKSASALSHPHIVSIYEIGEAPAVAPDGGDGSGETVHFMAMELVDGPTLRRKIHDERASLKDLLRWLAQAASGLAKAHAASIVHRDLKPDNVMVTADGFAKVLDFGLAKLVQPADDATQAATAIAPEGTAEGVVLGTAAYMSPEQVRGLSLDHRTDVFSFGCLLYEAATRTRPFRGETSIDTMHQVLRDEPIDVAELAPETPAALRRLIRRCLQKDPEQRFQSMKDLSLELTDLVDDFENLATTTGFAVSGPEVAQTSEQHRPPWRDVALVGLGGIVVAVLALAIGQSLGWFSAAGEPALESRHERAAASLQPVFSQLTTVDGIETMPDLSPDGNFIVYVGGEAGREDLFLLRVGGRNPINLTQSPDSAETSPAFSPDGQSIAFHSDRDGGGVFVIGATGESMRRVTDRGSSPDWSPDGTRLVVADEHITPSGPYGRSTVSRLLTVDVATGALDELYAGDAVQPRWSPDGRWIAFWGLLEWESGQRDIGVVSADGGDLVRITATPSVDWNPVWGATSDTLYFVSDRGGSTGPWRVGIDPETGVPVAEPAPVTTPARWSGHLSLSADGTALVFAAVDARSNIVRLDIDPAGATIESGPHPITTGSNDFIQPTVSPDGEWIAFRSNLPQEDIYLVGRDGSELRRLTDDQAKDRGPRWYPDGSRIVFYSDRSGRYELWSIRPDGSGLEQLTEQTDRSVWYPFLAPDGSAVYAINEFGTVAFDLTGGIPTRTATILPDPEPGHHFQAVGITPDGATLVGIRIRTTDAFRGDAILAYELSAGTYQTLFQGDLGGRFPALLAESRQVLFIHDDRIRTVDLDTAEVETLAHPDSDAWRGGLAEDLEARDLNSSIIGVGPGDRSLYLARGHVESDVWIAELGPAPADTP